MLLALLTSFAASRKEPLVQMLNRVHDAFLSASSDHTPPTIHFNFADGMPVRASIIDRAIKRFPELSRFITTAPPIPSMPTINAGRRLSNGPFSPAGDEQLPFATLQSIAAGVPRSFPFHSIALHFHSPAFGPFTPGSPSTPNAQFLPGVLLTDSWWVNGRTRTLSASAFVDADPASKKLPPHAPDLAAILAACGKIKRTTQAPLPARVDPSAAAQPQPALAQIPSPHVRLPQGFAIPSANPQAALAVRTVVQDYRARLPQLVTDAALPHTLPAPGADAYRDAPPGTTSGPRKPALDQAFKPLGYSCRGDTGTFTLRRRTPSNLTVELHLDVGTWSNSILALFHVYGLGFRASLPLPVSPTSHPAGQYPIGDAARWQKIVDNLAALVTHLERTFVPDIESAAGPSPAWYTPET
jgi:hypothetical protein